MDKELALVYDNGVKWLSIYGPRIIIAIIVFFAGEFLIRFIRDKMQRLMARSRMHKTLQPFFSSLVAILLQVALFLVLLQLLGIQLTLFAALVAALGAAIGLSLSGTLQNFASGILILLLKPFRSGDNIIAQGYEGTVSSIQLFYTVITTYDKRTVIVPNSKLSNEVILNITQQGIRRMDTNIKFPYKTPVAEVKDVLSGVIGQLKEIAADPEPRIGVSGFEENNYVITVSLWLQAHGFEDARLMVQEQMLQAISSSGLRGS